MQYLLRERVCLNEPGDVQETSRRVCRGHWAGSKESISSEKKKQPERLTIDEVGEFASFQFGVIVEAEKG